MLQSVIKARNLIVCVVAAQFFLSACVRRAEDVGKDAVVQRRLTPVVMGTTCRLIAVGPAPSVESALSEALRQLESIEALMSTYRPDSELSQLNRAAADVEVPLSTDTMAVLRAARMFCRKSDGAFDATIQPLSQVWSIAADKNELPSQAAIDEALARVGSEKIELRESAASKSVDGVHVSLDGIAKGYAVHLAVEAMRQLELRGALVDVGGDIECFGTPLDAEHWQVAIQSPWADSEQLVVLAPDGVQDRLGVCTSGNYRRYFDIEGRRYSHIIDPRTGRPADAWPSVTVIARDAMHADAWATALSVLGPDRGLELISANDDLAALFLSGDRARPEVRASAGFRGYLLIEDARLRWE